MFNNLAIVQIKGCQPEDISKFNNFDILKGQFIKENILLIEPKFNTEQKLQDINLNN